MTRNTKFVDRICKELHVFSNINIKIHVPKSIFNIFFFQILGVANFVPDMILYESLLKAFNELVSKVPIIIVCFLFRFRAWLCGYNGLRHVFSNRSDYWPPVPEQRCCCQDGQNPKLWHHTRDQSNSGNPKPKSSQSRMYPDSYRRCTPC